MLLFIITNGCALVNRKNRRFPAGLRSFFLIKLAEDVLQHKHRILVAVAVILRELRQQSGERFQIRRCLDFLGIARKDRIFLRSHCRPVHFFCDFVRHGEGHLCQLLGFAVKIDQRVQRHTIEHRQPF